MSCVKQESTNPSDGIDYSVDKPFLKEKILLNNGELCYAENPLIDGDNVIYFIEDEITGKGWINAYDKHTLELIWTWNEAHQQFGAKGFGNLSHIHDGILCVTQSNLSYGIDISNGNTIWHQKAESGQSTLTGIGDKIFKNTHEVFNADANLRVASTEDGVWSELYSVYQDDSMSVQMKTATLFEWQGKEYATFITSKWQPFPSIEHTWLNLYSLTEDRVVWQSDTIPLHHVLSGTPGRHPVFCDGQILIGNGGVYSYNIEDGSLEWWKHYGNTFVGLGSYLHAQDGIVYGNNEDGYLAAWDVHTGDEIFNVESGGLCSQIQICDNKLYQTSYSKNVFFVYDSSTGEKLYEVNAPYYERFTENDRLFFENVMVVDPETCLAYTTDKMHLLVYEFE